MSVSGVGTSILNKSFKSQLYYIEFDKFDNFPFQPFSSQAPGQALRLVKFWLSIVKFCASTPSAFETHAEDLVWQVAVDKCAIYYAIYSAQHQTRFHVLSIGKLFATQALSQTPQKNVSEPQTGIKPATF